MSARGDANRAGRGITAPACAWYARCDHPAVGTVDHPVLGPVPVCQRCADKHDLDLVLFTAPWTPRQPKKLKSYKGRRSARHNQTGETR